MNEQTGRRRRNSSSLHITHFIITDNTLLYVKYYFRRDVFFLNCTRVFTASAVHSVQRGEGRHRISKRLVETSPSPPTYRICRPAGKKKGNTWKNRSTPLDNRILKLYLWRNIRYTHCYSEIVENHGLLTRSRGI